MAWKPGECGNPGGRPKEYPEVKEAARKHTKAALKTLKTIMSDEKQPGSARVAAANALLDRGYGKAAQHISAEVTHSWESVATSEFDGWLTGLFEPGVTETERDRPN